MSEITPLRGRLAPILGDRLDALWGRFREDEPDGDATLFVARLRRDGHLTDDEVCEVFLRGEVTITLSDATSGAASEKPASTRYTELSRLGAGAMGEVVLATDPELRRQVALKRLHPHLTRDPALIRRFRTEAQITAQLDHPAIMPVFSFEVEADGTLAYAMKLIRGRTLDDVLHEARVAHQEGALPDGLSLRARLEIFLAVCDAMAYAHARGVIHRDLKPGNVLYSRATGHMRILVADFGLAWAWHRATAPQDGGTVAYAAPEQLLAQVTEQGPWTDLYALGCTAFRLVTGRQPYRGQTVDEIRRAHLFTAIPKVRARFAAPAELEEWIAGMLAKDPRRRYQRAADAAYGLLRLPAPVDDKVDEEDDIDTVSVFDAGAEGTRTLPVEAWIKRVPVPEDGGDTAASAARPPIPENWARPRRPSRKALGGRGLGLFGLGEPPVVGRQNERDVLWSALIDGDELKLAIIGGPHGVGKTHLASWLCERAHEVGVAEVFRGTFTEEPTEASGLAGLLQEQLRTHGMSGHELVRHLRTTLRADGLDEEDSASLARMLRPEDPFLATTSLSAEERVALAWEVMRHRTHGRRLLVVLDDAHLSADAGALLLHVARRGQVPGLVVLTLGSEVPATLRDQVEEAEAHLPVVRVPLAPLDAGETAALVQALLPVPDRLAERIAAASEGMPLATMRMVADLVQRGQLRGDASGVEVDPRVPLPDSLGSLWEGALERVTVLQPQGRAALEVAALLGATVALPEWRDAAQRLGATLDPQSLARMVEHGFVVPARGGGRYSFAHAVLRDALVEAVNREARATEVHRAIGDVLESRGDSRAAQCGQHLEAADEPSRAADAYLRAMRWVAEWDRERALELGARWYATLGKAATPDGDPRWSEGMQVLVELLGLVGGDAHRRATEELLERGRGDPQAETRALIELCRADLRAMALTRAAARAELAWRRCAGTGLEPQAAAVRAEVRRYKGDLTAAEEILRHALESFPDAPPLLLALSRVLIDAGRPQEALDLVQTWADRLTRAQAPMARARLQRARGAALMALGHTKCAVAALEEACQMRDRAGFDWPALDLDLAIALAPSDDGRARGIVSRILERLDPERDTRRRADALALLAELEAAIGAWEGLERCIDAIEDLPHAGRRVATALRLERVAARAQQLGEIALARRARKQAGLDLG